MVSRLTGDIKLTFSELNALARFSMIVRPAAQQGSFAPNARVTSALVNAANTSFIGDYSGNAAPGGFAHPVWTSGGGNNGRLETAALTTP